MTAPEQGIHKEGKRHEKLYFTAADGRTYRVYDGQIVDGDFRPVTLGERLARYRVFVEQDRHRYYYRFKDDESHALEAGQLDRQLRSAYPANTSDKASPRAAD